MNTTLEMQAFKKILFYISEMLQQELDIALYLTDREKCLAYFPSKTIDAKVREGDPIREDEPIYDVIHNNRKMNEVVPKEVFGFTFKGVGTPILDDEGQVIGAFAYSRNIEKETLITETSENMYSTLEEINASIGEIASKALNLSDYLSKIAQASEQTSNTINEAGSIIGAMQAISSQSNLLALNAAIESARAGEAGRGFSVVAEEMRKLSSLSNESASKVSSMLNEMKASIKNIADEISEISSISKAQVETTSQISTAIEDVTVSSEKLVELSKE